MKRLTKSEWIGVAVAIAVIAYFFFGGIADGIFGGSNSAAQGITGGTSSTTMETENTQGDGTVSATSSSTEGGSAPAGPAAVNGSIVTVLYTGKLQNGEVFDSSAKHGNQPFSFVLGAGQVISGWDKGLVGVRAGDKRTLTLSPEEAYGTLAPGETKRHPLQGETLIFDVEVVDVQNR